MCYVMLKYATNYVMMEYAHNTNRWQKDKSKLTYHTEIVKEAYPNLSRSYYQNIYNVLNQCKMSNKNNFVEQHVSWTCIEKCFILTQTLNIETLLISSTHLSYSNSFTSSTDLFTVLQHIVKTLIYILLSLFFWCYLVIV